MVAPSNPCTCDKASNITGEVGHEGPLIGEWPQQSPSPKLSASLDAQIIKNTIADKAPITCRPRKHMDASYGPSVGGSGQPDHHVKETLSVIEFENKRV